MSQIIIKNYKGKRIKDPKDNRTLIKLLSLFIIMSSIIMILFIGTTSTKEDNKLEVKEVEIKGVEVEDISLNYGVPLNINLQYYVHNLCKSEGIDPTIVFGMISKESNYDATMVGDNGDSIGLMQVQSKWHEDRMERLGVTDLTDPFQNVSVGIDYLTDLMKKYEGDMEKALMAYNAGPTGAYNYYFSKGIYSNSYSKGVLEQANIIRKNMQY